MPASSAPRMVVPLVAAAVIGGGVAAGLTALLDHGGTATSTTTVVQQAPLAASALETSHSDVPDSRLTAADIYKRYAPGVVYVRAEVVERTQSPFDVQPQEQRGE